MNKLFSKNKKAFTIIELIVVVAILGILVLLAGPRLLGYVEKAELARIQHDVKVMENKMAEVLTTDNNFNDWQNNGKDLGRVVMRKELYEKQGVAKSIDWEHLSAKWLRADKGVNQLVNKNNELGVGGDLIELDDKYSTYKIIPKEYSSEINTKLKGTFYVNSLGKVYYEHDKPLTKAGEKETLACPDPSSLGYDFRIIDGLGTIVKWSGTATHLVIPASFKMSEGGKEWCEPVRVIGKGAFQNRTFKRVTIPQSVETIQDEAFQGGELIEIEIPHSVINIGDNAFTGNPATSSGGTGGSGGSNIIIKGPSSGRDISDSAFGDSEYTYSPVTDKDLGVVTKVKNDNGEKTVSIIGKRPSNPGGGSSGSGGGTIGNSSNDTNYSNTVINIPKELEIGGEVLPVTEIDSGAFQGSGLIDVIMPEGLLYIHDYAFAGNQLIRVVIPNSVISVGNYAFAYNEIAEKPTIDPINILDSKFIGDFSYVNNDGNIGQSVSNIDLKDHIFIISSMGNHVIEDVGTNPEQPEDNNDDGDINDDSEVVAPGPQPSKPVEGATDGTYTFHGEVEAENFITGDELASKIGLTVGTAQHSTEPWLKFTRKESDEKITTMFVAKKPLRYNLSWDHINAVGAVFGTNIEIGGNTYKVRLMKGALTNPSKDLDSDLGAKGSEWNRMMLPIHEQAIDKTWAYPAYVEDNIKPFAHELGTGKNGMYTDCDLLTHSSCGSGSYSWTQETTKSSTSSHVLRGNNGVSNSTLIGPNTVGTYRGWRPVLELVR